MKKLIITIILGLPIFLKGQSLYQNPYLQYIDNQLDEGAFNFNSVFGYHGLGTKTLIKNYPTSLGFGMNSAFVPVGYQPTIFGIFSPFLPNTYHPEISLTGSHFGELDFTASGSYQIAQKFRSHAFFNGHFFKNEIDKNNDNFRDLPFKDRWFLGHQTSFKKNKYEGYLSGYYLSNKEENGELGFKKSRDFLTENKYGFGEETQQGGVYFYNKLDLVKKQNQQRQLLANISGRWHQSDNWFGLRKYAGKETLLESYVGYLQKTIFGEWQLGLKYRYQKTAETFAEINQNRKESVIGLYGKWQRAFNRKLQLKTFANFDYHNLLKWKFSPSGKLDFMPNNYFQLGVFGGSGYQFSNVLIENNQLLVTSRVVFLEDLKVTEAYYFGGIAKLNLENWFHWSRHSNLKVLFYQKNYKNLAVVDFLQNNSALYFYNLEGKARRYVLESVFSFSIKENFRFGINYRFDLAQNTINGAYQKLPLHSQHNLFFTANYRTPDYSIEPRISLRMTYLLRSPQLIPNQNTSLEKSPFQHRIDMRVTANFEYMRHLDLWKKFQFFIGVENLNNQQQKGLYLFDNQPFESNFDGGFLWGNLNRIKTYFGLKYRFEN